MALMRWSPARDLLSIPDEMNRLFNDFLGRTARERWGCGPSCSDCTSGSRALSR